MRAHQHIQGRDVEYDEVTLDQAEDLRAEGAVVIDVRRHDERAHKHDANLVLIGILPTLTQAHTVLDNLSSSVCVPIEKNRDGQRLSAMSNPYCFHFFIHKSGFARTLCVSRSRTG